MFLDVHRQSNLHPGILGSIFRRPRIRRLSDVLNHLGLCINEWPRIRRRINDLPMFDLPRIMALECETNARKSTGTKSRLLWLIRIRQLLVNFKVFFSRWSFLQISYFLSSKLIFLKMIIYEIAVFLIIWKANKIILFSDDSRKCDWKEWDFSKTMKNQFFHS